LFSVKAIFAVVSGVLLIQTSIFIMSVIKFNKSCRNNHFSTNIASVEGIIFFNKG